MSDTSRGYAHPELLVTAAELSREMAEAPDRLLLLDVRPAHQFAAGHLPHAVHLDLFGLSLTDSDPAPFKSFLWVIEHLLASRGVTADRRVVVYEEHVRHARRARVLVSRVLRAPAACACSTAARSAWRPPGSP